jgi:hypothetical protein
MRAHRRLDLRDEAGQTLAFAVLAIPILIGVLVLVVDAGGWFQARERAQSAADAAALSGARTLAGLDVRDRSAANLAKSAAEANPTVNGNSISVDFDDWDSPSIIDITARSDDTAKILPFPGVPDANIEASASARVQVPTSIDAVAPIALECGSLECGPWAGNPWNDGDPHPFTYDPARPGVSTVPTTRAFAPIRMSGVSQLSDFQKYVTCNAQTPGDTSSCNQNQVSAPRNFRRLALSGDDVSAAIGAAAGSEHLFAIFDSYSNPRYHVIGWAAGTFSGVTEDPITKRVSMQVTFNRILVDGSFVTAGGSGGLDFGVRAVALSG